MTQTSHTHRTEGAHDPQQREASSLETVEVRLRTALAESHYTALRSVTCRVTDGEVTLEGALDSYYHKQVAQAIASRVPGVRRVHNRIQVAHTRAARPHVSTPHGA